MTEIIQTREQSEQKILVGEGAKETTSSELQGDTLDPIEENVEYDELESKKLARKLDLRIMPLAM